MLRIHALRGFFLSFLFFSCIYFSTISFNMLFTVGPMLLGILPVLISTINKVYNNNLSPGKIAEKNRKKRGEKRGIIWHNLR